MAELHPRHTISARAGFTLVEVIMVLGVLAALAIMAIPVFNDYITKTRNKRCIGDIRTIDKAITSYALEKNGLPASLADVGMANILDPWGRPYQYQDLSLGGSPLEYPLSGDPLNQDYDLYSQGRDGVSTSAFGASSADDVVRANNGIFAGERS